MYTRSWTLGGLCGNRERDSEIAWNVLARKRSPRRKWKIPKETRVADRNSAPYLVAYLRLEFMQTSRIEWNVPMRRYSSNEVVLLERLFLFHLFLFLLFFRIFFHLFFNEIYIRAYAHLCIFGARKWLDEERKRRWTMEKVSADLQVLSDRGLMDRTWFLRLVGSPL